MLWRESCDGLPAVYCIEKPVAKRIQLRNGLGFASYEILNITF